MTTRRTVLTGIGAITAGGLLAACSTELPEAPSVPQGPTPAAPTPVASAQQISRYLGGIDAALTAADKARDAKKLAPRVVGSAAEFRAKSYGIIGKVPEWTQSLDGPNGEMVLAITSTGAEWPRTAIALAGGRLEGSAACFVALQQSNPRAPYTTWGWAHQSADVDLPMVPDASVGSEPVGPDTEGLVMTPAQALALYAQVLGWGDAKDPDDKLAPNPFQTQTHQQIQEERAQLNEGVEQDEAATIGERYTVREEEFVGLRTDDGGAIILGVLTSDRTVEIKNGARVEYPEENVYTVLAGRRLFTKEYRRQYGTTVALYIPTAEAGGQVQPFGVSRVLLGASGS